MPSVVGFLIALGFAAAAAEAGMEAPSPELRCDGPPTLGVCIKTPVELPNGDLLAWRSAPVQPEGHVVHCFRSTDHGRTWHYLSDIVSDPEPHADLGDGAFLVTSAGELLFSYRRNHRHGRPPERHSYRIEVAVSRDNGVHWTPHSTVAAAEGAPYGLWSSFLIELRDGVLQCYYDDEVTPAAHGLPRHQWFSMKTWNAEAEAWQDPVTVSRAHNPERLSRDGMGTVVELPDGELLCVMESVQTEERHAGLVLSVRSRDRGRTWSWSERERDVVYEPADTRYNALAPWMIPLEDGRLLVVFTTDEDRAEFGIASTGVLYQDLRYITSDDGGRTWSAPRIVSAAYPIYFPGVCQLRTGPAKGDVLIQYLHQHRGFFFQRGRFE